MWPLVKRIHEMAFMKDAFTFHPEKEEIAQRCNGEKNWVF
jgi:hypothetical protein